MSEDKMDLNGFLKSEYEFQKQYDDIKIDYTPIKVLIVTILRGRVKDSSLYKGKLKISVTCPQLYEFNQFTTKVNVNCEANETFKFLLGEDVDLTEEFLCQVKLLYGDGSCSDDAAVDVSQLCDKVTSHVTLGLEQDCEVDLQIKIRTMDSPDFRLGVGLHKGEKDFRKLRIPKVYENLRKILKPEEAPTKIEETPIISLCSSGGGYRSMVGTMGAIEALQDAGIKDCLTYVCGLSGSAWYLTTAYGTESVSPPHLKLFHESLKQKMTISVYRKLIDPWHFAEYWKYIKTKRRYSQPTSLVDLCGFTIGSVILGKGNMEKTLSDLGNYVKDASVPFPIFVSLHVKNTILSSGFHAFMECSPFEVSFPSFGIGLKPGDVGSIFNGGALVRKCPEFPLHLHQGITGAALALLFAATPGFGEVEDDFIDFMDRLRLDRKASVVEIENSEEEIDLASDASGDTEDDEYDDDVLEPPDDDSADLHFFPDDEKTKTPEEIRSENEVIINKLKTPKPKTPKPNSGDGGSFFSRAVNFVRSRFVGPAPNPESLVGRVRNSFGFNLLRNTAMKEDRDSYVGRTGKMFNFTYNLPNLPNLSMNPHGVSGTTFERMKCQDKRKRLVRKMSVNKKVISLVDAACHNNVAADIPMRPQRGTNVLIVTDFSEWASDDLMQPVTLLSAAANAWKEGLKFPLFDFKTILQLPPTECIVLEDENDDECPIVIWFTLCNKKFKEQQNYKPRSEAYKNMEDFNKFIVYGEKTAYSTMNLSFNPLDFERLRELMYFNVMSNMEVIKSAIARATERKRRVLKRNSEKKNNE